MNEQEKTEETENHDDVLRFPVDFPLSVLSVASCKIPFASLG